MVCFMYALIIDTPDQTIVLQIYCEQLQSLSEAGRIWHKSQLQAAHVEPGF